MKLNTNSYAWTPQHFAGTVIRVSHVRKNIEVKFQQVGLKSASPYVAIFTKIMFWLKSELLNPY